MLDKKTKQEKKTPGKFDVFPQRKKKKGFHVLKLPLVIKCAFSDAANVSWPRTKRGGLKSYPHLCTRWPPPEGLGVEIMFAQPIFSK